MDALQGAMQEEQNEIQNQSEQIQQTAAASGSSIMPLIHETPVHIAFANDFPSNESMNCETPITFTNSEGKSETFRIEVEGRCVNDSKEEIALFYIPHSVVAFDACAALPDFKNKLLKDLLLKNYSFKSEVFIYHENDFSLDQLVKLKAIYKSKGLLAEFRGIDYADKFTQPSLTPDKSISQP